MNAPSAYDVQVALSLVKAWEPGWNPDRRKRTNDQNTMADLAARVHQLEDIERMHSAAKGRIEALESTLRGIRDSASEVIL